MVPNLDCCSPEELMAFWGRYHRASRRDAEALVGDRRPGYTAVAATLANYACNKATATQCRLRGEVQAAEIYEDACDKIYARIPKDLRW